MYSAELGREYLMFAYESDVDSTVPFLKTDLDYALGQWSQLVDGKGTLRVRVNVADAAIARADVDVTGVAAGRGNGRNIALSSAVYELATGRHARSEPDQSGSDMVINLAPGYLRDLYFDPDPAMSGSIPPNKLDAVSVFEHEVAHALGITGFYPLDARSTSDSGPWASTFDNLIRFENGAPVFIGPLAMTAHNNLPVPLTILPPNDPNYSENIYHVARNFLDPLSTDLMSGVGLLEGFRYRISSVDAGIIGDVTGLTLHPAPPAPGEIEVDVVNTSTNQSLRVSLARYDGPVPGLTSEYIYAGSDNLSLSTLNGSVFLHSGSARSAIAVRTGDNVVDGSAGSSFLSGGTGNDTFFVDVRGLTTDIWSTIVGFHAGDQATIWGVTPNDFHMSWLDNQGAAVAQGLTCNLSADGKPTANITLAGYASEDLGTRLAISFGRTSATSGMAAADFMSIRG